MDRVMVLIERLVVRQQKKNNLSIVYKCTPQKIQPLVRLYKHSVLNNQRDRDRDRDRKGEG